MPLPGWPVMAPNAYDNNNIWHMQNGAKLKNKYQFFWYLFLS